MRTKKLVTHPYATKVASVIGTLGYLSVLLQWVWTLLILCYPLIVADHSILLPERPTYPIHAAPTSPVSTSPVLVVVAVIATVCVLALTVIVLARLPKNIGKQGARITHQTADAIVPLISHHKHIPKKKHLVLSYRIILAIKALLIALPLVELIFIPASVPLDPLIIWCIGIFCAAWSTCYFGLQQLIGIIIKLPLNRLW